MTNKRNKHQVWEVPEIELKLKPQRNLPGLVTYRCRVDFIRKIWKDSINIQKKTYAVFLNSRTQPLGFKLINTGTISIDDIDLVMATALKARAKSVFIVRSEPDGFISPTNADKKVVENFSIFLGLFEIKLTDYIIISETNYFSFKKEELL